jgi:hypothetical protein
MKFDYTVIMAYPVQDVNAKVETYATYVTASSREAAAEAGQYYASIDNDGSIAPDDFDVLYVIDGRVNFLNMQGE